MKTSGLGALEGTWQAASQLARLGHPASHGTGLRRSSRRNAPPAPFSVLGPFRVRVPIQIRENKKTPKRDCVWVFGALEGTRQAASQLARRPPCFARYRPAPLLAAKRAPGAFLCARTLSGSSPKENYAKEKARMKTSGLGALEGTRTPDLLVRSQSLYPAELPAHTCLSTASLL